MSGDRGRPQPMLGVYVHWPYCARICPYCDFNVFKNRSVDEGAWVRALTTDLETWARRTGPRRLTSLYFGGGTPSLAPLSVLESVIETAERLWGFEPQAEMTLEANPNDAERTLFRGFSAAGINRLSLGVQSLDDDALRFLGREHSAADAAKAIVAGLETFARLTFDLIYARPGQSDSSWRAELRQALSYGAKHLSLYQLTIEPGTAFERAVKRGRWSPLHDDVAADHFDIAQEETERAGLPAYEISNYAAPGEKSRHNLLYWTYQDYVGVGPGAHGRYWRDGSRIATVAPSNPAAYLAGATLAEETLAPDAVLAERLSMGLRLTEGLLLDADDVARLAPRATPLISDGLVNLTQGRFKATAAGRKVLNAVLAALL